MRSYWEQFHSWEKECIVRSYWEQFKSLRERMYREVELGTVSLPEKEFTVRSSWEQFHSLRKSLPWGRAGNSFTPWERVYREAELGTVSLPEKEFTVRSSWEQFHFPERKSLPMGAGGVGGGGLALPVHRVLISSTHWTKRIYSLRRLVCWKQWYNGISLALRTT